MLLTYDHMILFVTDLERAAADMAAAGFAVTRRADQPGGPSENRLVVFGDGSYLELLQISDPAYLARHRLRALMQAGEGWVDYSLASDDLEADKARLDAAGIPNARSPDYTRTLTDGRAWTVALIQAGRGTGRVELPFLARDGSPRALRVPDGKVKHDNGARRVVGATVLTDDLDGLVPSLDALVGAPGGAAEHPFGRARRWRFGDCWLDAVQPGPDAAGAQAHLARRGPGLFETVIETAGGRTGPVDAGLTHGGRLRLV